MECLPIYAIRILNIIQNSQCWTSYNKCRSLLPQKKACLLPDLLQSTHSTKLSLDAGSCMAMMDEPHWETGDSKCWRIPCLFLSVNKYFVQCNMKYLREFTPVSYAHFVCENQVFFVFQFIRHSACILHIDTYIITELFSNPFLI